jgi:hypothetical protein
VCGWNLFNLSKWSWRSGIANTVLGSLAYLAGVTLTSFLIALIGNTVLRWTLRVVASVPILVGLVLGTFGILGLMFIISDSTPSRIERLGPRYAGEVRLQGGAYTSEDFAEVTIARYFGPIPIQHTIWDKSFSDHQYDWGSTGPSITLSPDGRSAIVTSKRVGASGAEQDVINLP